MKLMKSALFQTILIVILFFSASNVSAQIINKTVADSIRFLPIELAEIPIRSAETLMKTNKILEDLISDNEISELKSHNDSVLSKVERENKAFKSETDIKNIRLLENRILQLKSQKQLVENERDRISSAVMKLDKSLKSLADEQKVWTATKEKISDTDLPKAVTKRIDLILDNLDSAFRSVSVKTDVILSTLDRSAKLSIEIELQIDKLNTTILNLEEKLLLTDYPSVFNLDYSPENLVFSGTFKNYVKNEWNEIKTYSAGKLNEFIITALLFIVLIYLFLINRISIIESQKSSTNFYKKKLGQVLARPVSTTIILTMFSTLLIFQNRPPAFRDFIVYIGIIPLLLLMKEILNKKLLYVIYGFALALMCNVVFFILQPENVIFRFNLVSIGLLELFLSWYFVFRLLDTLSDNNHLKSGFRLIGYIFLIMSGIGLFGAITGNVILSQKLLSATNITVIAGAILFSAVITIDGIIILLIDSKSASKVNFINNNGTLLKNRIVAILNFLTGYFIMVLLLKRLNLWFIIKTSVLDFFEREWSIGEFDFSLGTVVVFFLVIYISVLTGKIIQTILEDDVLSRMSLTKGLPHTISVLVKYTLVTMGLFFAISAAGMNLSSMTVIIGAFGVGIGFGLQNIFNNMVSGLILLFERPIQIGDTVEVGSLMGNVKSIGMRSSYIKTFDGAEVIVPNGQLVSNEVINWTLSDQQRRIEVIVGVSYNSDPHKVSELFKQILSNHKDIMSFPPPQILFNELGDSSLNFRLLFWTESISQWLQIKSDVIFKVFDVLKENNIEIPFPQRDIHVRSLVKDLNEVGLKKETPE